MQSSYASEQEESTQGDTEAKHQASTYMKLEKHVCVAGLLGPFALSLAEIVLSKS